MSHALSGRAPRILGRHDGRSGRWYGVHYRALEVRLGPFDDVTREYAGGASALWVTFRRDAEALNDAERARQSGKGRRPGVRELARLKKRQGLSWSSYDAALRRLEELAARRPPRAPMAAMAALPEIGQ